jgi:5-(hydroxymethyl)furfural/furfural oxidase
MQIPNPFDIISNPEHSRIRYDKLMARRSEGQEPRLYWRGRGVGGSLLINGQIAIRGMFEDFDNWAEQGCTGWSGEEILPAFIRLENDLDFGDKPYHGNSGPIPIYRAPREKWGPVDKALADAAIDSLDGIRVSTNDGYLEPARSRPNLTIMADTVVGCVAFDGNRGRPSLGGRSGLQGHRVRRSARDRRLHHAGERPCEHAPLDRRHRGAHGRETARVGGRRDCMA